MPRRLLCTVLALGLLASAAAAGLPDIVVRAGVNASTIDMDDLYEDAREGLALGLGVRLPLYEGITLMPEIWYMQKGFKEGTLWDNYEVHLQNRYETITVPLLLSYWFETRSAAPRAFIGLSADFVISNEIARREEAGGEYGPWTDVSDQAESMYWGLIIGGGCRFLGWLDLDVRYEHGITQVTNFDYEEFDDIVPEMHQFDNGYDRTWTLSAGVWF